MKSSVKRHVNNPCYRVTLKSEDEIKTWLFAYHEKELAENYYIKMKYLGKDVELFERIWSKIDKINRIMHGEIW